MSNIDDLEAAVAKSEAELEQLVKVQADAMGKVFAARSKYRDAKNQLRSALDRLYSQYNLKDYGG